jgi:hypothetical protein
MFQFEFHATWNEVDAREPELAALSRAPPSKTTHGLP